MGEGLRAGVGRVVITPPVGVPMSGFAGRDVAIAEHDPLKATVLALQCGETTGLLVALDLIFALDSQLEAWREALTDATGVPGERMLFCASHTHYGPDQNSDHELVVPWREALPAQLAAAGRQAMEALREVRLACGHGTSGIGVNRRERRDDGVIILGQNPSGVCDREVVMLRLDEPGGKPYAAIANFACHPVCGSSRTRDLSACWPGVARDRFEAETGATMLYLQGAAANINPWLMREGHEAAAESGQAAGAAFIDTWRTSIGIGGDHLAMASQRLELPAYSYGSLERAQAIVDEQRLAVETATHPGSKWWAEHVLKKAEAALAYHRDGTPLEPLVAHVNGWRIGDAALATAPGEIFCEIGLAVKAAAPTKAALYAAYTNGSIGYVPVPAAYPEGGYEVDRACRVDPPAAGMIETGCNEVVAAAWEG